MNSSWLQKIGEMKHSERDMFMKAAAGTFYRQKIEAGTENT